MLGGKKDNHYYTKPVVIYTLQHTSMTFQQPLQKDIKESQGRHKNRAVKKCSQK